MDVAAKRSDAMNSMAKIQLEQEKQKQKMMMEGVGTLMQSAGGLMGQMAADKKAEELKIASELEAEQQADDKRSFDRETLEIKQQRIRDEITALEERLENESDPDTRKALTDQIEAARARERQAGYNIQDFERQNPIINFEDNNSAEEETNNTSDDSTTTNEESSSTNNEDVEPEPEVSTNDSEPASNSEQSNSAGEAAQGS